MISDDRKALLVPHDEQAFFRGVYAMSEPYREAQRNLDVSRNEWKPGRVRAINRSYRQTKSPMWIGWFPSAKRPTRASLCKRARHAKRPNGRR